MKAEIVENWLYDLEEIPCFAYGTGKECYESGVDGSLVISSNCFICKMRQEMKELLEELKDGE